MNWRHIRTNCFLAQTTQTLCKIPFSSALLTCLVQTSNISSFSSSDPLPVKWPLSVKSCQNTWGAEADWKDWVALPVISGRGLSCSAALGGQSAQEGRGIRWDVESWFQWDEWTLWQPAVKWLSSLFPVENISITVFCFINIFLRSFFIFCIKENHPWRNNGWIL